ncbi:CoB--CoM heterodisulfide reductase iron-sulfur subunit B family protein [bacterium]|nr:CoB--CoM heterodisulfide reductase iron-sulfur subunit B family protein [bacterium]
MKFHYYPGCSVRGANSPFEESFLAVCKALGMDMQEIEDWNCCGATAYMAIDEKKALALAARNLAIAEKMGDEDIVTPCGGCYLVLKKSHDCFHGNGHSAKRREIIKKALSAADLSYKGSNRPRHILDVVVNTMGLQAVKDRVVRPLEGIKVAPYYGCQIVRPHNELDGVFYPMALDHLLEALGAEVVDFPMKARCCGGSLTGTVGKIGLELSQILLTEAKRRGADVIATACPLCHFNLSSYQDQVSKEFGGGGMPTAYFTQLMGVAFGMSVTEMGLQKNLVTCDKLMKLGASTAKAQPAEVN